VSYWQLWAWLQCDDSEKQLFVRKQHWRWTDAIPPPAKYFRKAPALFQTVSNDEFPDGSVEQTIWGFGLGKHAIISTKSAFTGETNSG